MTSIDTAGPEDSESEISATLVSLRECFEGVRRDAIQRVRGRLGNLSPDQENAIDSLSHALVERVLQAPMAMLKNASAGNHAVSVVETVRRLFNLARKKLRAPLLTTSKKEVSRVYGPSHLGARRWLARSPAVTAVGAP
jgi:hypothetical protein